MINNEKNSERNIKACATEKEKAVSCDYGANTCIACGVIIPEGNLVCQKCASSQATDNTIKKI